jgi:hypothetical protein
VRLGLEVVNNCRLKRSSRWNSRVLGGARPTDSDLNHEALTDHVETVEFRRKRLKLISKRKLLEIKLAIDPPRQKDQIDIEILRKHV